MEAIRNSLCRQRRVVKLLILVVIVTVSWHRSHARNDQRPSLLFTALPNALSRLTSHDNSSSVCVEDTAPFLTNGGIVRGGYRGDPTLDEEKSTIAVEAPIIRKHLSRASETQDDQEFVFSLFQPGDGHETDADGIPQRYLKMHNGKRELSKESLESTLTWRTEHSIDRLLQSPHEQFDVCKSVFPHYFAGRDRENHVVFVQRPGMLRMDLADANHLSKEALLRTYGCHKIVLSHDACASGHYVYVNEYLWQIVETEHPMAVMLGIIDLQGINLKTLRQGDIIPFLKEFVKTMDMHYPQRAHKTLLINAPKWFHLIYKLVSPLLRETTKEKIEILSRGKKQDAVLNHRLPDAKNVLPESFFSSYKKKKKNHRRRKQQHNDQEAESDDEEQAPDSSARTESQLESDLREFVRYRVLGWIVPCPHHT